MNNDIYYAVAHRGQEEIDSFAKRYDTFDDTLIPQIFSEALELTATSWKPSDSWGSSHVIYFVQVKQQPNPLVLRANTGFGEPEVVMLTEKLITDQVLSMGLETNKILYVDVSRKQFAFDFQIQETLGGTDPEIDFPDGKKEYDQLSYDVGQYIAKLSDFTLPGFGRLDEKSALSGELKGSKNELFKYITLNLEDDFSYLHKEALLTTKEIDQVMSVFQDNKKILNIKKGSIVHHDLADHNLRYKDGHLLAIFDWEAMVIGDPALDLASCPTWGTLYPREEKLLAGYQSITKLPKDYQQKKDLYVLRTILWKTVFCIRANILTDKRADRMKNALKPFGL